MGTSRNGIYLQGSQAQRFVQDEQRQKKFDTIRQNRSIKPAQQTALKQTQICLQ